MYRVKQNKFGATKINRFHTKSGSTLLFCHSHGVNGQPRLILGGFNRIDHRFPAVLGASFPVQADRTKHAMFDGIPLA